MNIFDLLKDPEMKNKKVVEKLIEYYMNIARKDIFTSYDIEIENDIEAKIRKGHDEFYYDKKPLEYILGYVEFFGIRFKVSKDTLIPRPETEYMIKAVNDFLNGKLKIENGKFSLIDVGTGCGVLGLSTLIFNHEIIENAVLCDLSENAIGVAKENRLDLTENGKLKIENISLSFLKSNLVQFLIDNTVDISKIMNIQNLLIVANLPYIPEETFENNVEDNVKKWEPKMAFVGGDDGLDLYRIMFSQLFEFKKSYNGEITMFLEMMTWQVEILEKEFGDKMDFEMVETFHFNIKIVKATLK